MHCAAYLSAKYFECCRVASSPGTAFLVAGAAAPATATAATTKIGRLRGCGSGSCTPTNLQATASTARFFTIAKAATTTQMRNGRLKICVQAGPGRPSASP